MAFGVCKTIFFDVFFAMCSPGPSPRAVPRPPLTPLPTTTSPSEVRHVRLLPDRIARESHPHVDDKNGGLQRQ